LENLKRYQDTVLRAWLEMLFIWTPRYQQQKQNILFSLSSTKTALLTPTRYDKHPYPFYMEITPPRFPSPKPSIPPVFLYFAFKKLHYRTANNTC